MIRILDTIALILLIIGGIDLGLVGIFNYDFIIHIFSDTLIAAHLSFFTIGLAAIYLSVRFGQVIKSLQPYEKP